MFRRSRNNYRFNAIALFSMVLILPIFLTIIAIIYPENLKVGEAIGYSLFGMILFLIVGAINMSLYNSEKFADEQKDKRIKHLEKKLKEKEEKEGS